MQPKNPQLEHLSREIERQAKEIARLTYRIEKLERDVILLSRENNRRRLDINQVANAVRKN